MLPGAEYDLKDGRKVLIRQAEEKDILPIIHIMDSVASEGYSPSASLSEQHKEHIADRIRERTNVTAVGVLEGIIVGECDLSASPSREWSKHVAELGLNVMEGFCGIGVGNAMMDYMIDAAKNRRYEKISLSVLATNERAINLYKKHGFIVEGSRKNQFRRNDAYIDEVLMGEFL